uniref:Death domain-containing protein n=2 Tax=Macrostomum lignano TaxID=282301 RepID=A0A1I8HVK3_9PLAT
LNHEFATPGSPRKNTLKPAIFSFPLPLNPPVIPAAIGAAGPSGLAVNGHGGLGGTGLTNGKRRPGTAADPRDAQLTPTLTYRPMTGKLPAMARRGVDSALKCTEEFLILVGREGARRSTWKLLTDVKLQEESGKDIVSFRTSVLCDRRFIAFRILSDFNLDMIARICETIERSLEEKSVCFVIRQRPEKLTEVSRPRVCRAESQCAEQEHPYLLMHQAVVSLTMTSKLDRTLRQMHDCGYSYEPSMHGTTEEIKARERQAFRLRFRGNIDSEEEGDKGDTGASEFVMLFNSQMRTRLLLNVVEKDRFAQRALDQYRGFLEIFTDVVVVKPGQQLGPKRTGGCGGSGSSVLMTEEVNVARLLVSIPKTPDELRVKSAVTSPFSSEQRHYENAEIIFISDAVSAEYLKDLASLVADRWEQLAEKLDVSKKRCSVIKRNNDCSQKMAYDMLITWVKGLPVLKDKVQILSRALHCSGHPQLAANLRQLDNEHRQRQANREI